MDQLPHAQMAGRASASARPYFVTESNRLMGPSISRRSAPVGSRWIENKRRRKRSFLNSARTASGLAPSTRAVSFVARRSTARALLELVAVDEHPRRRARDPGELVLALQVGEEPALELLDRKPVLGRDLIEHRLAIEPRGRLERLAHRGSALEHLLAQRDRVALEVDLELEPVVNQLAQPVGELAVTRADVDRAPRLGELGAGLPDVRIRDLHELLGDVERAPLAVGPHRHELEHALASSRVHEVSGKQRAPSGAGS